MAEDRVPPRAVEVEKTLLGELLLSPEAAAQVVAILRPEDFYLSRHRTLYRAIVSLTEEGTPVDLVTVSEKLTQQRELDEVGGLVYLIDLTKAVVSTAQAPQHAQVVLEKSRLRQVIRTTDKAMRRAYAQQPLDDVVGELQGDIIEILSRSPNDRVIRETSLDTAWEEMQRRKDEFIGPKTPWPSLNDILLYGFSPRTMSIFAGRPKIGKTTLKYNLMRHWLQNGVSVFSWTPEMGLVREFYLLAAIFNSWSVDDLVAGRIPEDRIKQFIEQAAANWQLVIFDKRSVSLLEFLSVVRRVMAERRVDIVVMDMFDRLADITNAVQNKPQVIKQALERLYAFADEQRVHLCLFWQLNRDLEKRKDHRPRLSDLADSGGAEQVADLIAFLHREGFYRDDVDEREMEVIVKAQRGSGAKTGKVYLQLVGDVELRESEDVVAESGLVFDEDETPPF